MFTNTHCWYKILITEKNFKNLKRICFYLYLLWGMYICDVTDQKPGACHHLSFATNAILSNFIEKIKFFVQFYIFVPNYSEGSYF